MLLKNWFRQNNRLRYCCLFWIQKLGNKHAPLRFVRDTLLDIFSSAQEHCPFSPADAQKAKNPPRGSDKVKDDSPHRLTGSVSFLTDYRSRGISQTMNRATVQGQLKYAHERGFYFTSWASNVDGTTHFLNNTSSEWNFYIGFEHPVFCTDLKYDAGFLIYYYPGGATNIPNRISYNTVEYYFGLSYKGFNIKLYQTLNDYFDVNSLAPPFNWSKGAFSAPNGHSRYSPYIEANYEFSPYPRWTTGLHAGYQGVTNYPKLNYFDWQVSLAYEFEWVDFSLFYIATNAKHAFYDIPDNDVPPSIRRLGAPTLVASISKDF